MAILSGNAYAFGAYQVDIKKKMNLSQSEIEFLGLSMHMGVFLLKPFGGVLYDQYGPQVLAFFAAFLFGSGFLGASYIVSLDGHTRLGLIFCCLCFTNVGWASGIGSVLSVSTNAKNFHSIHRGKVVGIMIGFFGLSAMVVSLIYVQGMAHFEASTRLPLFFLVMAMATTIFYLLGTIYVKEIQLPPELLSSARPSDESRALRTISISTNGQQTETDDEVAFLPENWTQKRVGLIAAVINLSKSLAFWEIYIPFAAGTGCGLYVINNVGSMYESLNGAHDKHIVQQMVVTLSIFNCLGRVTLGWLSDAIRVPRGFFLSFCILLASCTLFMTSMFTFHNARYLFTTFALAGYSYGGLWAIAPTMLSEIFGLTNFGKVYGLVTTAPAMASLLFNGVASVVYEAHVEEGNADKACYGSDCFWGSLIFSASVCLVVAVGSFLRFWHMMRHVHPQ